MTTSDDFILCRMTMNLQGHDGKTLRAGWIYWLLGTDPDVKMWLATGKAVHEVELEAEADALDAAEAEEEPVESAAVGEVLADMAEAIPALNNDHEDDGA